MGLGGSIALIAIGLILALAVDIQIAGVDVHLIGWILTGVGVLALVIYFAVWAPRRRATTVQRQGYTDPRGGFVEERRTYDDPL